MWLLTHRSELRSRLIADRHYNRQKVGSRGFVPPGRCIVLLAKSEDALWVTSWPFAQYVRHAWVGAWVNTLFRNESIDEASFLIREAISVTRSFWVAPPLGLVSFVDPKHVRPTKIRGKTIYGYCYLKAGFTHVGFTKGGLWVWQILPHEMPEAMSDGL